jgi:flagellar hook-associated protein 1 FlgK
VQVTTIPADDGTCGVFIGGGQRLVLGKQATTLAGARPVRRRAGSASSTTARARTARRACSAPAASAACCAFQDEDLAERAQQLGQMATALATRLNEQQALGLDLRSPAGSGAPLLHRRRAAGAAASGNARDAAGNFVASVTMPIADAASCRPSEYELRADPATPAVPADAPQRRPGAQHRQRRHGRRLTITIGAPAPPRPTASCCSR